ncbi:acidic proline-rich protein HP43A-like [Periplaneta americana]|uniref:acidic proline-rich protein HP43A-like n=1 Tax=Periplaneta americana TaxID=6978 RepID=UPI0037E77C1E
MVVNCAMQWGNVIAQMLEAAIDSRFGRDIDGRYPGNRRSRRDDYLQHSGDRRRHRGPATQPGQQQWPRSQRPAAQPGQQQRPPPARLAAPPVQQQYSSPPRLAAPPVQQQYSSPPRLAAQPVQQWPSPPRPEHVAGTSGSSPSRRSSWS